MGAANDLIVLFLGLEMLSLALYVLAASNRRRARARRAASSTSCSAGSRRRSSSTASPWCTAPRLHELTTIVATCRAAVPVERNDALVLAGVALLLVGLGFKVAAVPFHFWTPDVYQGAPTPVTAFMASVGKVAAFAALLRVLVVGAAVLPRRLAPGHLGARRADAGRRLGARRRADRRQADARLLVDQPRRVHPRRRRGRGAPGRRGRQRPRRARVLVYLLPTPCSSPARSPSSPSSPGAATRHTTSTPSAGSAAPAPLLALALTVFLLAQAGVPLTSGFIAKFGVIEAGVEEQATRSRSSRWSPR